MEDRAGSQQQQESLRRITQELKVIKPAPQAHGPNHVKMSDLWTLNNLLVKINGQLNEGYTVDAPKLREVVDACIKFVANIVEVKNGSEVSENT